MVGFDGLIAIDVSLRLFDFTVRVVDPVRVDRMGDLTVMVAVRSAAPGTLVSVTRPLEPVALLIVARLVSEEDQLTHSVRSWAMK